MTTGLRGIGHSAIGVTSAADGAAAKGAHKAVFAPRVQLHAAHRNTCAQMAVFGDAYTLPALAALIQTAPARFQAARHIHIRLIVP
ncbi:MAG TPA: hypothetical protein PLX33_11075 [Alphaproteobacteria bacterium]|nr:hypothetical protein [Alphaproteobacteria bacterium]